MIFISYLFFRKELIIPLLNLTKTAKNISLGKFLKTNLENRQDEIGILAKTLNKTITTLEQSNQKTAELINNLTELPTPVVKMDTEFNVTFINTAGAQVAGFTVNECIGKKCYDLFKTYDCNTDKCACAQAMQKKTIINEETVAKPNSDTTIPIAYTGSPIVDKNGKVTGVLEFIMDQSKIYNVAKQLDGTANKVETVVDHLGGATNIVNSSIEEMNSQANQVAAASEEMNTNVATVASSSEQASANVSNMATAAEEMSNNITTVASAIGLPV